jgi:hypothetical protein
MQETRLPFGKGDLNNCNIVTLNQRIKQTIKRPRNSVANRTLGPIEAKRLMNMTNTTMDTGPTSPINNFTKTTQGNYKKDNTYKMIFTKGHYERTYQMGHLEITDPFKIHQLTFESTKE